MGSSSKLHLALTTAETDTEHYAYTYTYDKTGIRFENGCYYEINVKMKKDPIDLSRIDAPFTAVDGDVLTGVLSQKYPIEIAAGAAIRLKNATIFFDADDEEELTSFETRHYRFAGLTCEGDADIHVEGHNIVRGFHWYYPGIFVPQGCVLRIYDGDGDDVQELLEVSSNGYAAGIGGGYHAACGNILVSHYADVYVKRGSAEADYIGHGVEGTCGDVDILNANYVHKEN